MLSGIREICSLLIIVLVVLYFVNLCFKSKKSKSFKIRLIECIVCFVILLLISALLIFDIIDGKEIISNIVCLIVWIPNFVLAFLKLKKIQKLNTPV